MLPEKLRLEIAEDLAGHPYPREKALDVMFLLQQYHGYLSDEAVAEAAALLGMTPLEVEELATFYDFIYREPVGRYVIHVCDGVVCWMHHENSIFAYLYRKLGVGVGETTPDGLFTVLPTACLGDCHHAPSMLINGELYGSLTPELIDAVLEKLRTEPAECVICR